MQKKVENGELLPPTSDRCTTGRGINMLTNTICNNFTIINAYDTAVSAVDNNFYFPWAKECGITMPKEWIN